MGKNTKRDKLDIATPLYAAKFLSYLIVFVTSFFLYLKPLNDLDLSSILWSIILFVFIFIFGILTYRTALEMYALELKIQSIPLIFRLVENKVGNPWLYNKTTRFFKPKNSGNRKINSWLQISIILILFCSFLLLISRIIIFAISMLSGGSGSINGLTLLGSVIGGVIASLLAITIWEWYHQPKLVFGIPDGEPLVKADLSPKIALYHLEAKNVGRAPAYDCRIKIDFFNKKTLEQLFSVSGKWDRGPQPLLYAYLPTKIADLNIEYIKKPIFHDFLVPFAEVIDLQPQTSDKFCFLIKYENEAECYAFSSWSYDALGLKVDHWKLNSGDYIMEVEVAYSGKKSSENFSLINQSNDLAGVEIKKCEEKW